MKLVDNPFLSFGRRPRREEKARVLARGQALGFNYG